VSMRSRALSRALVAVIMLAAAARAHAQDGPFVEAMAELSPVHIGGYQSTWRVGRIGAGVQRDGRYGWNAGVERHQRGGLIDWAGQAGAFQRLGNWTWSGTAGYADAPGFLYRRSLEGQLSRRVVGGLVLGGGYRHLEFPTTTVRIVEPSASFYFPRGEIGAQGFLVRNDSSARRSSVALLRSAVDLSRHVSVTGGAAIGARIFDVDTFGRGSHDAWQAFGSMRVRAGARLSMELMAGGAHEDPLFTQQTIATRVRWSF
jgi:YaiO family outer membrane protein